MCRASQLLLRVGLLGTSEDATWVVVAALECCRGRCGGDDSSTKTARLAPSSATESAPVASTATTRRPLVVGQVDGRPVESRAEWDGPIDYTGAGAVDAAVLFLDTCDPTHGPCEELRSESRRQPASQPHVLDNAVWMWVCLSQGV